MGQTEFRQVASGSGLIPRRKINMAGAIRSILLTCAGLAVSGCASFRESPNRSFSSPTTTPQEASLFREYLLAAVNSQGTYLCKRIGAETGVSYRRRQLQSGRAEGVLADADVLPLSRFLDPNSTGIMHDQFPWAKLGTKTNGYIVLFHPSVPEFPDPLNANSYAVRAGMTVFDFSGVPFAEGTATREVEFGGWGPAKSGDREFSKCARINVDTDFAFGWWCKVGIHESMMVDREFGIIQRTEQISGNAMIVFNFYSTRIYELVTPAESTKPIESKSSSVIPRWSGLAIQIERIFHEPAIKGLVAEFETSNSDSTAPILARE